MQIDRPPSRRRRWLFLVALASTVLVCAAYLAPGVNFLDRLEYRTVDWRFRMRGNLKPDPRVAIVEVNDDSLQRVGKWPWPRATWARLTDLLTAAGARFIVFDIFFPEYEGGQTASGEGLTGGDRAFVEATRRSGKVYHAAFASATTAATRPGADESDPFSLPVRVHPGKGLNAGARLGELPGLLTCFRELSQAAAGIGFADVLDAGDGVFRYVFPLARVGGRVCPSLALRVAYDQVAVGDEPVEVQLGKAVCIGTALRIPLDRAGRTIINFAGPSGTYPRINAADVLEGKVDPGALRGRFLLIAATAPGLHDLRPSPFGAIFDGAESQANLLDNLLTARFLVEATPEQVLLLIVAAGAVTALAFVILSSRRALAAAVFLLAAYLSLVLVAFRGLGVVLPVLAPSLNLALTLLGSLVLALVAQERATRSAYDALGRYVSAEVVRRLDSGHADSGQGVRRTVTVLFSDLRDFTGRTARLQPEEVVTLLNRYFTLMYETLTEFGGTLDKYMGDGLMAYFLSPEGDSQQAALAVHAAMEMQRRIELNREEWAFLGMADLEAGIGLATGEEILGDIGSPDRMQYTVIGPEVNLAARLMELTKSLPADIIMDERTYELAKDYIEARCLGPVVVQGLEDPIVVYQALHQYMRQEPGEAGPKAGGTAPDPPAN